jgi:hypothetical protein
MRRRITELISSRNRARISARPQDHWSVVLSADGANILSADRAWYVRANTVKLKITDEVGIELLKQSRDVQWQAGQWLVDFTSKFIWIGNDGDDGAAGQLEMIISRLHENKGVYDVDIKTGFTTERALRDWSAAGHEDLYKNLTPAGRRLLLTLLRLEWKVSFSIIKILAEACPNFAQKPGKSFLWDIFKTAVDIRLCSINIMRLVCDAF